MDLQTWREQKETGMTAEETQPDVQDAAVQETDEQIDDLEQDGDGQEDIEADEQEDTAEESDDASDIEIPQEQKTAFQKALEREKRKADERLAEREEQLKREFEQQQNPYKTFFETLGIQDPDVALNAIRQQQEEQRLRQQVEDYAYENGWTEEQLNQYVHQQQETKRMSDELNDLRVSSQIAELSDNPDYAGIKGMKDQLKQKITASGGALTVEEAYWALGGKDRAQQLKREAEQREIAKRSKAKRTVQTDNTITATGEKPLPDDVRQAAKAAGISEKEARRLVDMPNDLEGWRKWKQTQRRV